LLSYPATIPLSTRTLAWLAEQIRTGRQALLVLAHLRCGDTYARLAAGFGVGVATVYRYVTETIDLISKLAPTLEQAARRAAMLVW